MPATKTLSVPIAPGMREDLSPHAAPVGTLKNAVNVRFPVQGEIEARRGTVALSTNTDAGISYQTLGSGARGPEFLARVDGGFVFGLKGFGFRYDLGLGRVHTSGSYGNALPQGRIVTMAREELSTFSLPVSQVAVDGYIAVLYSSTASESWFIQVYTEGGTLVGSLHSYADGATAGWLVRDGSSSTTFVALRQIGTAIQGAIVTLSSSGISIGAYTTVGTLVGASSHWAVCYWPLTGWALQYQSGATTVTIKKLSGVTTGATATYTTADVGTLLSLYADTTNLYVGWSEVAGGVCNSNGKVFDTSLSVTGAATVLQATGAPLQTLTAPQFGSSAQANTAFAVIGNSQGPGIYPQSIRAVTFTALGGLTTAGTDGDMYGLSPVGAPFNNGMIWCRKELGNGIPSVRNVLVDYQIDRGGTSRLKNPKIALVTDEFVNLVSSTYSAAYSGNQWGTPVQLSDGRWLSGLPRIVRIEALQASDSGLALAEWVTFTTEANRQAAVLSNRVLIPGDPVYCEHPWGTTIADTVLSAAAQELGQDIGFYAPPTISTAVNSTSTGNLTPASTYFYRAVIERIDSTGARYRSAPSAAAKMTTGASDNTGSITVLFTDQILRGLTKGSSAFDPPTVSRYVCHIYRTAAGGSTFYRATPPQGAPQFLAGTLTFTDLLSDAKLTTREILYTDGGVLDNNHPSSCRFIKATEDRVWLGGLWDTNQIQSSKVLVPGEPPQFSDSPAFRVVLPEPCTGIAIQDGVVVAFAERGIYAIQGTGPNDQGQGAWDSPRVITRSVGCINALSILETSAGTFFQSNRGIELLPRGCGEPQFVGGGVQDTLGSHLVTSAAVISNERTQTARFTLDGDAKTKVLVFDLQGGGWSVDQYPMDVFAICDTDSGAVLAVHPNTSTYGFLLEYPTAASDSEGDSPAPVPSILEWTALHPFGVAGWGRFTSCVAMFDELTFDSSPGYQAGNCSLFMSASSQADTGATFDMTNFSAPKIVRHTPLSPVGYFANLKLATEVLGWRFLGWTVELDQQDGGARTAETEQR